MKITDIVTDRPVEGPHGWLQRFDEGRLEGDRVLLLIPERKSWVPTGFKDAVPARPAFERSVPAGWCTWAQAIPGPASAPPKPPAAPAAPSTRAKTRP